MPNFLEYIPISETITGIIAATIGWVTGGRTQKQSIEVQNAQTVLSMWQQTAETQRQEINDLKSEIREMMERINVMEGHINKLEVENKKLRIRLSKMGQEE